MSNDVHDVVVLGGGLAGLTLAIQLRQRDPGLRVLVVERRSHPVREAAFKVGESTVEIGAHYFAETLGLRGHLDAAHLRKFGFRFFFSHGQGRIEDCTELGVEDYLAVPTWQIDRGRFENFLAGHAQACGVEFVDGATVQTIALSEDAAPHRVAYRRGDAVHEVATRWVVDASGRAGLLKRRLGLAEANGHEANAAWFRIGQWLEVDGWSEDADWRGRCAHAHRWRSTNHLVGPGYWVWLIPLGSGAHSVGIVADARMHPLETMNTFERAMAWLHAHQPALARRLEPGRERLQDFLFLRDFSYGCRQVFSARRWALTGEAGLFLDPFYSPGSDYIAIANTYIVDLVARERGGGDIGPHAELYQRLYFSFYASTLALYQDQYALFGDPRVMPAKVLWDYAYYWGVLCPLALGGRLTDLALLSRLRTPLARAAALNLGVQALLRDWHAADPGGAEEGAAIMLNQSRLDWFVRLNGALAESVEGAVLDARIGANVALLETLAAELLERARRVAPGAGRALAELGVEAADGTAAPLLPEIWSRGRATRVA
ncbi:NAD(P)/FAD-dependent oxidoreductase [Coralloluteibacterium thermophilus]|uniref:NAD(P)/FAD-dependent oxidoreductase n=1 Tax=Coralloluteibacterium thermophilum TaxID=2707049 RepID=A0ABV9NHA2_9GAMM